MLLGWVAGLWLAWKERAQPDRISLVTPTPGASPSPEVNAYPQYFSTRGLQPGELLKWEEPGETLTYVFILQDQGFETHLLGPPQPLHRKGKLSHDTIERLLNGVGARLEDRQTRGPCQLELNGRTWQVGYDSELYALKRRNRNAGQFLP
ncbi:MAG: hypothetical protein AB1758_11275 [Candidatus Eremiobacterota bacterium]